MLEAQHGLMKSMEADLRRLMADVFGVDVGQITEDASIDTIDAWDSVRHLNLVLALEERFAVTFTEQETVEILNYELIRAILKDHGVDLAA
jgi:acyl carrier protein